MTKVQPFSPVVKQPTYQTYRLEHPRTHTFFKLKGKTLDKLWKFIFDRRVTSTNIQHPPDNGGYVMKEPKTFLPL